MDQIELGRWMGHISARVEQVERDIRQLKRDTRPLRPPDVGPSPLMTLLPYFLYGASLFGLAVAGKITWLQVIDKLAP